MYRRLWYDLKSQVIERFVNKRRHIPLPISRSVYDLAFITVKNRNIGVCREIGNMWRQLVKKWFICNSCLRMR